MVAKLSDATVLETFEEIEKLINESLNTTEVRTQYYFWGRDTGAAAEATRDAIKSFPKQQLISRITLNYYTNNNSLFELTFQRYCVDQNGEPAFDSSVNDGVYFNKTSSQFNLQTTAAIISLLTRKLGLNSAAGNSKSKENAKILEGTLKTTHDTLTNSITTINEQLLETRQNLESEYRKTIEELENKFRAKNEELEHQHDQKLKELSQKETKLHDWQKELDDRANTHARREIRKDLKSEISQRTASFTITKETKKLRLAIHITCIIGLILLLFGVGYFSFKSANLIDTTSNSLVALTILLKPFALTIAFLGLLTYYIRWMNRWFDRHADAEFQLRKLSLDVDRASWVIESALE